MSEWKFIQIEPQPARGRFQESMWDDPNWAAEEKYDGDRRIFQFFKGYARVTGRRKSVKDGLFVEKTFNVPHLSGLEHVQGFSLKNKMYDIPHELEGTVLDGEMIHPSRAEGGQSKLVTSIMGSLPDKAVEKQVKTGWLQYVAFDILYHRGEDVRWLPLAERRSLLVKEMQVWNNSNAILAEQIWNDKQTFLDQIYARGGEGIILKHRTHTYGQHLRWVKVKNEATADVIITGFKPAREMSKKVTGEVSATKYADNGWIGAVLGSQYKSKDRAGRPLDLIEVASVSGMDEYQRKAFTENQDWYMGKVMEITHNGREPTGKFRHPRYCRIRTDKDPDQCVFWEGES